MSFHMMGPGPGVQLGKCVICGRKSIRAEREEDGLCVPCADLALVIRPIGFSPLDRAWTEYQTKIAYEDWLRAFKRNTL